MMSLLTEVANRQTPHFPPSLLVTSKSKSDQLSTQKSQKMNRGLTNYKSPYLSNLYVLMRLFELRQSSGMCDTILSLSIHKEGFQVGFVCLVPFDKICALLQNLNRSQLSYPSFQLSKPLCCLWVIHLVTHCFDNENHRLIYW